MLKLLLHGCAGKMGRTLATCAASVEALTVVAGVDAFGGEDCAFPVYRSFDEVREEVDMIVDFSRADAVTGLLKFVCAKKIPCVIATTGHTAAQKALIADAAREIPVFYSANFSIPVNVLRQLCRRAAALLGEDFDIEIVEKHHNQKVDAPSGTALLLADGIAQVLPEEPNYVYDRHCAQNARTKNEIGISSVRGGSIVGEHEVIFAGQNEVLTLTHTAYSRDIFARGALRAALFLEGKDKGLYDMESLIEEATR